MVSEWLHSEKGSLLTPMSKSGKKEIGKDREVIKVSRNCQTQDQEMTPADGAAPHRIGFG